MFYWADMTNNKQLKKKVSKIHFGRLTVFSVRFLFIFFNFGPLRDRSLSGQNKNDNEHKYIENHSIRTCSAVARCIFHFVSNKLSPPRRAPDKTEKQKNKKHTFKRLSTQKKQK